MTLSTKHPLVLLQVLVAMVAVIGLGACGRSQHVTDSITGVGRGNAGSFQGGTPVVDALSFTPSTVAGGGSSAGSVTLDRLAPAGGAIVALASSNAALASVPASVTIAAGATSASFTVTTTVPAANSSAIISGTLNAVVRTATLNVTAPSLSSVSLAPASVFAGGPSTGTVTLTAAAPAGGALIALSSNTPALASVPASVSIAAGATSATFAVTTTPSALGASVIITGTYNAIARTATLLVAASNPCASLTGLGGAAVISLASVPQFRTTRLRVDLVGDVPAGWVNAMGGCTTSAAPSVTFVSGTGNVTLAGTNTSITSAGGPLTFGPLLVPIVPPEPGVVLNIDPAGNVLQIIWPALAGLPAGPPVFRMNLASWSAAAQTGVALDATMTFTARNLDGSTATFTARGTGMVIPAFRP